jgi:predicted small metal-binding protein
VSLGYKFKCSDLGLNCNFEADGETAEAVLKQATGHAMQAHRAEAMMLATKVRDAIKKT